MVDRYWFRPHPMGTGVPDLTKPAPGSPGTVGSRPAPQVTPVHPIQHRSGGLAEAMPQQEPAPIVGGIGTSIAEGPQAHYEFIPVRTPERVSFGNVTIPATAGLLATALLAPVGQTGILRHINVMASNVVLGSAANVTINVQSFYGEIYLQAVAAFGTAALSAVLMDFDDLYLPFKNGLQLAVTPLAAATSGNVFANSVWIF